MNEVMIKNWNEVVSPSDTIYHLGDFALGPKTLWRGYMERLNGTKILVKGNHDMPAAKMKELGFDEVVDSLIMQHGDYDIYLAHYPHPEFVDVLPKGMGPTPKTRYGFCGHVHTDWVTYGSVLVNVGVDQWQYKPITLEQALNALKSGQSANDDV